jgi:Tfp pilus assembly protein PilO
VSLSARDRKLVLVVAPVALVAAFWFLLLGPMLGTAGAVRDEVDTKQAARDAAVARVAELERARASYAADYETVVRLGKAIPTGTDMPSLLLQVDDAARGTRIDFRTITPGERAAAPADAAAPGAAATTPPASSGQGVDPADTQTSRDARATPAPAAGATGLETVPVELALTGGFFDLAAFLHRQKRFVRVAGGQVVVEGRLMTVDSFSLTPVEGSGRLSVDMSATVYLSPRAALPGPGSPGTAATPAPAVGASASAGGPPAR